MTIIIKFILRNIKEKKFRAFLVIFSIMASTALFFASSGTASTIKKTFTDVTKQYSGNADIQIYATSKSPSPYVSTGKARMFMSRVDYIIGESDAYATYTKDNKSRQVMLRGFNYEDVKAMNPLDLYRSSAISPFIGNKIIISKKAADSYGLSIGSRIPMKANNGLVTFTVCGIAQNTGFFALESDKTMMAIVPFNTAGILNNVKTLSSNIYIKVKNNKDMDSLIKDLSKVYKDYTVEKSIDENALEEQTGQITMAFRAMMMVVLLMSMFIIYTVFKVIVTERLPVIGTFRSVGATKLSTSTVLMGESVIYGIIGGVIGDFAGIGILKLLAKIMSKQLSDDITINVSIDYTLGQLVWAFIFAIAVSFISSIIPIIKTTRLSVKDVVLNTVDIPQEQRLWKLVLGIAMVLIALVIPRVTSADLVGKGSAMVIQIICMIVSIVGVIVCIPYITEVFVKVFEKIYGIILGNEGILAAKNLRKNRSLINNIVLLTIGISTLFMLNVVSYSMGKEIVKAYGIFKYDVWVENDDGNSLSIGTINRIRQTEGVTEAEPVYFSYDVEIEGTTNKLQGIYFMNNYDIKNYLDIKLFQNENDILKSFQNGRNIIMTVTDLKKMNKKVGDCITIRTPRGNREYKILGSFNTLMNNGSTSILPEKYARGDFSLPQYSFVYIKTYKSPDTVRDVLINKLKTKQVVIKTLEQRQKENEQQINKTLFLIKAFPIIALIIGTVGVVNNFLISLMERKRSLAIYASVGMSKRQTRKMLFIESISIGVIGSICGIIGGFFMTEIMPFILKLADFPMDMHYSKNVFIISIVLGILISIFSSLIPTIKSSKLNIIEAIKYE